MNIKIGTRGSKLALIQTEYVAEKLKEKYPENEYETVIIKTKGDIVQDKPLSSIGSSGVFVKEIEEKLRNVEIDMAVHSMKDMPAYPAEGLTFSKCWKREDNRDVLIINSKKNPGKKSIMDLEKGAVIGTGSIRRRVMLNNLRSDINVVNIRGNVDTRLKKMEEQELDGIILAAAGLKRLGLESLITCYFDIDEMIPSPAQGILALECRSEDTHIKEMLDCLCDEGSHIEGTCEREFLRKMGADCHVPVGAACEFCKEKGTLQLTAFYGRVDGSRTASVKVSGENPQKLAQTAAAEIRKKLAGKVWLVGAGPGDTGLMTLRGREIIEKADCIVYDRLANDELLNWCRDDCEKIYVGKENHYHTMKQEDINSLLVKKSLEYDNVVRLKGGDPYVFGRGGEECLALSDAGVTFETIPGVTSAIAGLGSAGIPITHRGIASGMRIVTAHNKNDELADIDFKSMAAGNETLVFMMGLSKLEEICKKLTEAGMDSGTPVAVISNATTKRQKTVVATLKDIVEKVKQTEGIVSPALIAVGQVVNLREKLFNNNLDNSLEKKSDNYSRNNVFYESDEMGNEKRDCKKYIIPKIGKEKSALAELVRKKGYNPIEIQLGQIVAVNVRIDEKMLLENQLIIFTSTNGVKYFFESLNKSGLDTRSLYNCKVAAVGRKTAEALKGFGIKADIIPKEHNSDSLTNMIIDFIKENSLKKINILYVKGKNVQNSITLRLKEWGKITEVEVYENKKIDINTEERQKIIKDTKEAEGILFTCSSNVERFFDIFNNMEEDVMKKNITEENVPDFSRKKIISIGKKCSKALEDAGITNYIQAGEADYEGIVAAMQQ